MLIVSWGEVKLGRWFNCLSMVVSEKKGMEEGKRRERKRGMYEFLMGDGG
jgi:hypothetical protein